MSLVTDGPVQTSVPSLHAAAERVLIVEDDAAARVGLEQLVKSWGFVADSAADGEDALEKVTSFRPAIVISDLVMPRMDGRRFRELQRQEPALAGIPTVLMTASRNVDGIPADAVIFKPLEFDQLLDIVRHHCG